MKFVMLLTVLLLYTSCNTKRLTEDRVIKRVALVIGNQDYGENSLLNPINDAMGIKKTLERIGFNVTIRNNLTLSTFYMALEEFKKRLNLTIR